MVYLVVRRALFVCPQHLCCRQCLFAWDPAVSRPCAYRGGTVTHARLLGWIVSHRTC